MPTNSRAPRRRRRPTAVTIHDVAARAGVSVATVSRVLNQKTPVREETSRHVLEAARSLRYVPNTAARALSIRRSHAIGIVLPDVHGQFFSEVIRGIDLAARRAGYHILVSGSHSDREEMLAVLEAMRGRVDGMVVMSPDVATTSLRDAFAADQPLVLLNSVVAGHDSITIDNYGGARAMVRHLVRLGHTRIAFIKGPEHNADAAERLRGYRRAMRAVSDERADGLELAGDFSEQSGYAAARELVAGRAQATALFAANDAMAVGALSALGESGVEVPADLSVVGFDDIPIARYLAPPLTTVTVNMAELGRRAFELVLDAIDGPARPGREECIPTSLVVRRSCGAPNAARRKTESTEVRKHKRQEEAP